MAWFKDWFNTSYYHILYSDRDFKEAEIFISKLTEFLELPDGAKIIDLACGKGRHSVYMNSLGFDVLGLDLSEESILHNKQFENTLLKFEVHDMREEIYPAILTEKADAILNLFTSFGYFEDENDDNRVFSSVYNALDSKGIFVLDFLNERYVENTLVAETEQHKGDITFHIRKRIENRHVIKDIIFEDKGEQFHYFEKVKLHTKDEIVELAKRHSFKLREVFGNYHLENFELETSPRCILILEKL